jgi:energy-coupling factor transporter ATP-binding protein EcfA2
MLSDLSIENLALFERADVRFGGGLNAITGETGAGKSLLLDALELLMGEKPRGSLVRKGADEARVEGRFVLVDCVAHGGVHGGADMADDAANGPSSPRPLLALAPSMQPATAAAAPAQPDCALMSFCPSKRPMRLVHDRISKLFRDIRLDELCSLPASAAAGAATTPPKALATGTTARTR